MTSTQKIIKYCAIGFALFIIINISMGLVYGFSFITSLFDDTEVSEKFDTLNVAPDAHVIKLDLRATNLKIMSGPVLKAETNNKYITVKEEGNQLHIDEKKHSSVSYKNNDLIVYIPDGQLFDAIYLSAGAGKIDISNITANRLYFNLGAGDTVINTLNVFEEAEIEGGVGRLEIGNGTIKDLDLNLGVGETSIKTMLTGENSIETGVGSVNLQLLGYKDDYSIHVEKGLGSINIDGQDVASETTHGTGFTKVQIDGGIGSIKVKYANNVR